MTTFNEHYLQWRNRARKYSRHSLLGAAQRSLGIAGRPDVEGLQQMPWLSLLAIKWICQDRMLDHGLGRTISGNEYVELLNQLWNMPVHEGRQGISMDLRIRQLLRPQVGFQRRFTIGHFREAAFLDRLRTDDRLRQLFEQRTGLTPAAFIDLAFSVLGILLQGGLALTTRSLDPLAGLYCSGTINAFLSLISLDGQELLAFCRSLPGASFKNTSEYFEFPALSRYPFRRVGTELHCWHAQLFYRGIEGMVHSVMSEAGQDYMDRFSRMFESHVVAEAQSLGVPCHDDKVLRDWLGQSARVPELLLEYPDANVFIEAKAGMFDESVMTAGSAEIIPSKFRAIRYAMNQGWSAALGVRESASVPGEIRRASRSYLLVVTNKNLAASQGTRLANMAPPSAFSPDRSEALEALPLDHIYIVSIDDFERLVSAARTSDMDLPGFLDRCIADDDDPRTSKFFFDQHLDHHNVPHRFSALVADAVEAATARLEKCLLAAEQQPGIVV